MDTRSARWKDRRESIGFAVLVNSAILCFLLLVFRPVFETNDDMAIALFINGAKGTYDAHLVYSNYLLGLLLSALYRFSGALPWYTLLQYTALFLSFTAIWHVLSRRLKSASACWILLIVTLIFAYDGYIHLQYTKTAGLVSAAGILLLLSCAESDRMSGKTLFCGYLLACLGFMYREQQFLAELALLSGIGVFFLLEGTGTLRMREWLRRCALIFGFLAVFVVCLHAADRYAYRSPQWQEYLEYNELRTELLDYGFPDFEENKKVYRQLGINRTALQLYRGWNYADTEKFTPETMRSLIALKKPKVLNVQLVLDFLKTVPRRLIRRTSFCCLLMVFLYGLCFGRRTKRTFLAMLYEALLTVALYMALFYSGRYLYNRVDVGLWFAVTLTLLWMLPIGKTAFSSRVGAVLFCIALCLLQLPWNDSWRIRSTSALARMQGERAALEAVSADKEHLYVVKSGALSYAAGYGVFDTLPYGISENVLLLGGWPAFTPGYREQMEANGITNPYRDLIDSEQLYLADRDIDTTLKYIRKYYDKSAKAVLISEYPRCKIYRITSG